MNNDWNDNAKDALQDTAKEQYAEDGQVNYADQNEPINDYANGAQGEGAGYGGEASPAPNHESRGNDQGFSAIGSAKDSAGERYVQSGGSDRPRHSMLKTISLVLVGAILGSGITMASGRLILGENAPKVIGSGTSQAQRVSTIVSAPPVDLGTTPENIVAQKVTPSVVGITTETKVQQFNSSFFGFNFPGGNGGSNIIEGVGSGVIVSSDGYILTNAHVVGGQDTKLKVVFSDETTVDGEVLWSDDTLDLAIVKVSAANLTPVEIGASSSVKVGDKAIAIGNPLGLDLQSTLTSGYISGLDRSISLQDGATMTGLIQTDAAINEGNSGGALLNAAGQLIGINTAKAGGTTSGIGFAIPIDTATPIIQKVMTKGSFASVYLGVGGIDVATVKAVGKETAFSGEDGVYVMEVMAGTAADKAGIKVEDIITNIDGKPVSSMTELKKVLLNYAVGDTVKLTISRNNAEKTLTLTFAQDSSNIDEFRSTQAAPEAGNGQ